jgi:putative acetyltransferase
MPVSVREMRTEDAHAFLEAHHAAVRELASADYSSKVIEAWAPRPITAEHVAFVRSNPDREYRLVAESEDRIVGIGCLAAQKDEILACYVAPSASRSGVGSAILRELERVAEGRGALLLELDSSLTAEPFYRNRGYEVQGAGEQVLNNGTLMACVRMRKFLRSSDSSLGA